MKDRDETKTQASILLIFLYWLSWLSSIFEMSCQTQLLSWFEVEFGLWQFLKIWNGGSATPFTQNPPHYLLAIHIQMMVNSMLCLWFPRFVGVGLIIRIKANLVRLWLDKPTRTEICNSCNFGDEHSNIWISEYPPPNPRILEYTRLPNCNIRIRISNIRTKLFEYSLITVTYPPNTNSVLAISQLSLIPFWWNLRSRFIFTLEQILIVRATLAHA